MYKEFYLFHILSTPGIVVIFIMRHSIGNLLTILIWISLITQETELLFIYLLSIWISCFQCQFIFYSFIIMFLLMYKNSLYILKSRMYVLNIFSHSVICLFTLLKESFDEKKFCILMLSDSFFPYINAFSSLLFAYLKFRKTFCIFF